MPDDDSSSTVGERLAERLGAHVAALDLHVDRTRVFLRTHAEPVRWWRRAYGFCVVMIPLPIRPSGRALPASVRAALRKLGFVPLRVELQGVVPLALPVERWTGPEGFVSLEAGFLPRVHFLSTYFEDGHVIATWPAHAAETSRRNNPDKHVLAQTGDFERDYHQHLSAVFAAMDAGRRPLHRPDGSLVRAVWRFHAHYVVSQQIATAAIMHIVTLAVVTLLSVRGALR